MASATDGDDSLTIALSGDDEGMQAALQTVWDELGALREQFPDGIDGGEGEREMDERDATGAAVAWAATGVDLTQPIRLTPRITVGCYYDGPQGTAWATVSGPPEPCAVPGCGALVSRSYVGVIVPGRYPIRVCGAHVIVATVTDRESAGAGEGAEE